MKTHSLWIHKQFYRGQVVSSDFLCGGRVPKLAGLRKPWVKEAFMFSFLQFQNTKVFHAR